MRRKPPLDSGVETGMLGKWGGDRNPRSWRAELEPDPRESPFELPPIDGQPFADDTRRRRRSAASSSRRSTSAPRRRERVPRWRYASAGARGEPLAEREAELVHRAAGQRSVGELLLLGPVEEVQEGARPSRSGRVGLLPGRQPQRSSSCTSSARSPSVSVGSCTASRPASSACSCSTPSAIGSCGATAGGRRCGRGRGRTGKARPARDRRGASGSGTASSAPRCTRSSRGRCRA